MSKKSEPSAEPKKKVLYTLSLTPEQANALKVWCDRQLWVPHEVEYAQFGYKGDGVNVVMYTSGKLVVQGKKTEEFVTYVLEGEITKDPRLGYDVFHHPEWFEAHGGLDESGKGDLFGPVVSACVLVDAGVAQTWLDMGIRDSKSISSDAEIFRLETLIRRTQGVVVQTTFANMRRYNELYLKFGSNLNKLLAWMHSKSLGEALKLKRVPWAMLDQFTKQPLVQN
ncbi:MAG: ribonuclease HIII, partial [Verrucomicrobia bacterium 21-51-4]